MLENQRFLAFFVLVLAWFYTILLATRSVSATIYLAKYYLLDKWLYRKKLASKKELYKRDGEKLRE
jgi:hypothetical protein